MSRAQPTDHVSSPPSADRDWTFKLRGSIATITVRARSWFAARDAAAARLGVERDHLEFVP